jgi:hypothetical protein
MTIKEPITIISEPLTFWFTKSNACLFDFPMCAIDYKGESCKEQKIDENVSKHFEYIFEKMYAIYFDEKNVKIVRAQDENVNGYQLYDYNENYDINDELIDKYNDKTVMSFDEFYEEFDNITCTEWAKIDDNGISFAGYWKYPKESYEYENAYHLTFEDNCKKVYELPYSHKLKLWATKYSCEFSYNESVRDTNYWCELVKRKIEKINNT